MNRGADAPLDGAQVAPEVIFSAIDAVNGEDPRRHADGPLALIEGSLATTWLARLQPEASAELQIACRAHHLARWQVPRADYPTGRAGYLRWRRDNKAHQAASTATILRDHDWPSAGIARVEELLKRTGLRSDPETQTLEDVACLVFLETQFADMTERTDHDHMVSIVAKTLKKMSSTAIDHAAAIDLDDAGAKVICEAVAALGAQHD